MKVRQIPMQMSECHRNAAVLWERNIHDTTLYTGYCLDDDGLWRQHSWVAKCGRLIETTSKRKKYYGIVLKDQSALRFFLGNCCPCPRCIEMILAKNHKFRTLMRQGLRDEERN